MGEKEIEEGESLLREKETELSEGEAKFLDGKKEFYDRGLRNWSQERGWLMDTCLDGQDTVKAYLDYFHVEYQR